MDWINVCYIQSRTKINNFWYFIHVERRYETVTVQMRTSQKTRELCLFLLSLNNLAVVLGYLILQDKHDIRTLSGNIKLICTRCETGQKSSLKPRFRTFLIEFPVLKKATRDIFCH